jgi:hypothetical protein
MSEIAPGAVSCPSCCATWSAPLFCAVDADTIQLQVDAIVAGTFERTTCAVCGCTFRPEHPLLFASHALGLWIVMHPLADRRVFAELERAVERVIRVNIAMAAPVVAERLSGLRPRLVFGQRMLSEAVRATREGIDTSLLECAKLLGFRRNLPEMMALGPCELCYQRRDGNTLVCAVYSLPGGVLLRELALTGDLLVEADASRDELQARFPDLFDRPYMSATRYLLQGTV